MKMADSLPSAVSHTARQLGCAGAVTVGGGQSLTGQRPSFKLGQQHREKDSGDGYVHLKGQKNKTDKQEKTLRPTLCK